MFVPVNKLFTLEISWTYLEHIHDYIKDRNDKVFSGRLASCISFGQQSTTTECIEIRFLFFMSLRIRKKFRYNSFFLNLQLSGTYAECTNIGPDILSSVL